MKRILLLALALCCLVGCGKTSDKHPTETSAAPPHTIAPPSTSEPAGPAQLTASYTSAPVAAPDVDISDGYTPAVDIMLWTDRAITDLRVVSLGFDGDGRHYADKTLYTRERLTEADDAFILRMVFWGDIPSTGLAYTDADGSERLYSIGMSGKDGSIVLAEILPPVRVTLTVKDATPTGLTLVAEADRQQTYGEAFMLEVERDGLWSPCPTIVREVIVPAIAYELPANTAWEIKVGWATIYGSLAPGHYRIFKDFSGTRHIAEFVLE